MSVVLSEKLKLLPDAPGVYIMFDKNGTVIYVGKARVLKNRVRQYFHSSQKPEKVRAMVECIADFSYVVTPTEVDALALENTYIKKYKPKYNILLKDDKNYPYIKLHTREEYPRISVTRKVGKDGKYFGPFMCGVSCKDIVDVACKVYGIRACSVGCGGKPKKPCLEYHLKRCLAPCAGLCEGGDYAQCVEKVAAFLGGNYEEAERILTEKMNAFAANEEFELALEYRNRIKMLSALKSRRITAMPRDVDADIWAFATNGLYSCAVLLMTRMGIMQGSCQFSLEEGAGTGGENFLSFLVQYYASHPLPHELILGEEADDELLADYAARKSTRRLVITRPKAGVKRELLDMANKNAEEYLEKAIGKIEHRNDMTVNACKRLQQLLGLERYPRRMECYDISNISGVDKVGSMVVFTDGEADKMQYRRFRIKTVEGADDFASLKEVLTRRILKLSGEDSDRFPKPDLIIIDGGKGQLSSVKEVFDGLGVSDIELVSLAKREEEVFFPDRSESVKIDHRDYALKLLQRIRDEAHRFAITYFRNLHTKRNLASLLEEIGGIGSVRRRALLERFGSIDAIMHAGVEEIESVSGIGHDTAVRIKRFFEEL